MWDLKCVQRSLTLVLHLTFVNCANVELPFYILNKMMTISLQEVSLSIPLSVLQEQMIFLLGADSIQIYFVITFFHVLIIELLIIFRCYYDLLHFFLLKKNNLSLVNYDISLPTRIKDKIRIDRRKL